MDKKTQEPAVDNRRQALTPQVLRASIEGVLRTEHKGLTAKIPKGTTEEFNVPLILDQLEYQFKDPKKGSKLMACSPASIAGVVKHCIQMGLEPGYGQGTPDVYLIPYASELNCQLSYQGELKLAHRAGKYKSVYSAIVYKGDDIKIWNEIDGQRFKHEVLQFDDRSDENIHSVYAIALTNEGVPYVELMTKKQLDQLEQDTRKGGSMSPAWKNWFGSMARKTLLRKVAKNLPLSAAQALAETLENSNNTVETIDVGVNTTPNKLKQLRAEAHS